MYLACGFFPCKRFWGWFTQSWIPRNPEDFYKVLNILAYISRDENHRIWPILLSAPHWNHSLFKLTKIACICFVIACKSPWEVWMKHAAKVKYSCYGKHIASPQPSRPLPQGVWFPHSSLTFFFFLHKICWYERRFENPLRAFHREEDWSFFPIFSIFCLFISSSSPSTEHFRKVPTHSLKLKLHTHTYIYAFVSGYVTITKYIYLITPSAQLPY